MSTDWNEVQKVCPSLSSRAGFAFIDYSGRRKPSRFSLQTYFDSRTLFVALLTHSLAFAEHDRQKVVNSNCLGMLRGGKRWQVRDGLDLVFGSSAMQFCLQMEIVVQRILYNLLCALARPFSLIHRRIDDSLERLGNCRKSRHEIGKCFLLQPILYRFPRPYAEVPRPILSVPARQYVFRRVHAIAIDDFARNSAFVNRFPPSRSTLQVRHAMRYGREPRCDAQGSLWQF